MDKPVMLEGGERKLTSEEFDRVLEEVKNILEDEEIISEIKKKKASLMAMVTLIFSYLPFVKEKGIDNDSLLELVAITFIVGYESAKKEN
jgi:hypothetical protein